MPKHTLSLNKADCLLVIDGDFGKCYGNLMDHVGWCSNAFSVSEMIVRQAFWLPLPNHDVFCKRRGSADPPYAEIPCRILLEYSGIFGQSWD